jgi:UDP-glucose 4-epimerase
MIILVTGSTGFVGVRLLNKLKTFGYELRVISRKPVPDVETFVLDFNESNIPSEALSGVDTIFHLAGYAHDVSSNRSSKDLYYSINVDSTAQLAKLAVENNVKKFIYLSSVKAGCRSINGRCISEVDEGSPIGLYGKTKREGELKLMRIAGKHMHVSIIRSSLVYGPNVKGNLHLMFSGIKRGWFPPLPETGNRRSMIHVDDLVRALLFVKNEKLTNGEIFNLTDGQLYSSRQIYEAMCHALDKPIPKWNVPKFCFTLLSLTSPNLKFKIEKLLGDECYSSVKIKSLGFIPKKSIMEINETSY